MEDKVASGLSSFSYKMSGIQLKIDMPEEKNDQINKTKEKTVEIYSEMIHINFKTNFKITMINIFKVR